MEARNNPVFELTKKQYEKYYGKPLTNIELKRFVDYCESDKPIEGIKQNFNFINCYACLNGISSREADMLWGNGIICKTIRNTER